MTAPAPERSVVKITDDTTREELAVTLGLLNDNAKRIGRRGYAGVSSAAYACEHKRINLLLEAWEDAPVSTTTTR